MLNFWSISVNPKSWVYNCLTHFNDLKWPWLWCSRVLIYFICLFLFFFSSPVRFSWDPEDWTSFTSPSAWRAWVQPRHSSHWNQWKTQTFRWGKSEVRYCNIVNVTCVLCKLCCDWEPGCKTILIPLIWTDMERVLVLKYLCTHVTMSL